MKTLSVLVAALTAGLVPVAAQSFTAYEPEDQEIVEDVEITDTRPRVEGIVTQIFNKRPWQAVNPAAPAKYGSGEKNVSKDTGPGTPYHSTGLVVAGVEW